MSTPFKAIGVLALSSLAIACSSQPEDTLASFRAQCKATTAPIAGETSIQGMTLVGTSIADAPLIHQQQRLLAMMGVQINFMWSMLRQNASMSYPWTKTAAHHKPRL